MSQDLPVAAPKGFQFSARAAGIRKSGRLDLALICSETPAHCAGVFTTNKVVAAPVTLSAPRVRAGQCQAILVNSGNANACTGAEGMAAAKRCSELLSGLMQLDEALVAVSSTGVIGQQLPLARFEEHLPQLVEELDAGQVDKVAAAIMTTDSFPKLVERRGSLDGVPYSLLGIAKGAGMIHPNMATMLAFVLTDARVAPELLPGALKIAVDQSFNVITVDRDTSTNDMVLLLANGAAGTAESSHATPEADRFQQQLNEVLLELAKMIVRDGEGATKLVEICVSGAVDVEQARQAACSVATSNLVKTAFFGEDANWGRIIAAVGYSGVEVDPERIAISFEQVPVVRNGLSTGPELEKEATAVLKRPEFRVGIDLGLGSGECSYYTSDLTFDYVKINADYRT